MKTAMKTLATCKPTEFLRQTNLIRKSAEKWLKDTKILDIRKNKPEIPEDATEDQKKEIYAAQIKKNLSEMATAILDTNADESLELLALCCFVDPADVDSHPMEEYLSALSDMLNNQSVIGFFISLVRWANGDILNSAKR